MQLALEQCDCVHKLLGKYGAPCQGFAFKGCSMGPIECLLEPLGFFALLCDNRLLHSNQR